MTTKTSNTPKKYTFKELHKLKKDCEKNAKRLYEALRQALPEEYQAAFWNLMVLQRADPFTADETWLNIFESVLKEVPKREKELKAGRI